MTGGKPVEPIRTITNEGGVVVDPGFGPVATKDVGNGFSKLISKNHAYTAGCQDGFPLSGFSGDQSKYPDDQQ